MKKGGGGGGNLAEHKMLFHWQIRRHVTAISYQAASFYIPKESLRES